jgi:hypothetical protein
MTFEQLLSAAALFVSLTLGAFVLLRDWWAKRHADTVLEVDVDDRIAERRRVELERLYERVEKLEGIVDRLEKSDTDKQKTINSQASELEKTNTLLSDLRTAFTAFVGRVERAWEDGHPKPSLTEQERSLLENTIPRNLLFKEH